MTATTELPAPDLSPYTSAQVAFAVAAWPLRAAEELRSGLIFRAIARAAILTGVPPPWPARFAAATRDELRHTRLCATVGARLGAAAPRYDALPSRRRVASIPDLEERLLSLLLVEVAIGETISTSLFHAGRQDASEPLTRAALGSILADEARHMRLGWSSLTALWPALSPARRAFAQREARRALGACERSTARPAMEALRRGEPFDPAYAALGVLRPEARIEAFYAAVEERVVPALTRLGLDGPAAWKDRYAEG